MKTHPLIACVVLFTLFATVSVFGQESPAPASADTEKSGPPEEVVRKLAFMMPEQKFKRESTTVSDGKIAPKDAVIYPVQILNADGSLLMKVFFFQESDNWAVFDEAGQVFRPTK
ncbi:MAG: hypothetical protein DLM73_03020 [Chthoniobacterales bacterium]|nr:MAG: hypothetical protein DLM73_03020 [Chthoniobacterales bacterium]